MAQPAAPAPGEDLAAVEVEAVGAGARGQLLAVGEEDDGAVGACALEERSAAPFPLPPRITSSLEIMSPLALRYSPFGLPETTLLQKMREPESDIACLTEASPEPGLLSTISPPSFSGSMLTGLSWPSNHQ